MMPFAVLLVKMKEDVLLLISVIVLVPKAGGDNTARKVCSQP